MGDKKEPVVLHCNAGERLAIELLGEKIQSLQAKMRALIIDVVREHGENPEKRWTLMDGNRIVEAE